ncbi:hypothetical protein PG994_015173 [Apiospora phragmitis]|uniref:Tr-type G domain-containing protein n=1 Tax=Apiospora phragmitis TaxID=2905665 RepID=A0ABR1SX21_9PEZI
MAPAADTPLPVRWASSSPAVKRAFPKLERSIAVIPIKRLRNLCIVANSDQVKSTLSGRLLEITSTISSADNKQILGTLEVEHQRGITVKAQTCSMTYSLTSSKPGARRLPRQGDPVFHQMWRRRAARRRQPGHPAQTVANFCASSPGLPDPARHPPDRPERRRRPACPRLARGYFRA